MLTEKMAIQQETTETLLYNFDFPMLTESGSVLIADNQIILNFPEKPTISVKDSIKIPQNINVFLENNLRFSFNWIPMHTWADYYRARDMLETCLQSYSYLTGNVNFSPHTFISNPSKCHDSIITNLTIPNSFSINCLEQSYDTCIQLFLQNTTENCEKNEPIHFQICIGKNLIFCTHRDLNLVTHAKHVHFIVQFILYKLLNY